MDRVLPIQVEGEISTPSSIKQGFACYINKTLHELYWINPDENIDEYHGAILANSEWDARLIKGIIDNENYYWLPVDKPIGWHL